MLQKPRFAPFVALTAFAFSFGCGGAQLPPSGPVPTPTAAPTAAPLASPVPAPTEALPEGIAPKPVAGPGMVAAPDLGPDGLPLLLPRFVAPKPPFAAAAPHPLPVGKGAAPVLKKLKEEKNQITDELAWFAANGLTLPTRLENGFPRPTEGLPANLGARRLLRQIDHGDHQVLIYGANGSGGYLVLIADPRGTPTKLFDLSSFGAYPQVVPADRDYVGGGVSWAILREGVLYASTSHHTYAKSTFGKNAFVSALDAGTGELLWQSAPLVCNAMNFVLRGDHLLCGYGFTAEPDFLYVLSRADGKVASKLPLKSGPSYLVEKGAKLYVRTYDTNYVFELR